MKNPPSQPICWIIAGPNGAGKTTFALRYLPKVAQCRSFINADLIAAGLSPLAPEQQSLAASRIFLHEIELVSPNGKILLLKPLWQEKLICDLSKASRINTGE